MNLLPIPAFPPLPAAVRKRSRPGQKPPPQAALLQAAHDGDLEQLRQLHAQSPELVLTATSFGSALHAAASGGHRTSMEWLLGAGVPVHAKSAHGHTALHVAAHFGHADAVQVALAAGASPAARDKDGLTPLLHACEERCIGMLLGAGAVLQAVGATDVHAAKFDTVSCLSCLRKRAATAHGVAKQRQAGAALRLVEEAVQRENQWSRAARMCDVPRLAELLERGQPIDAKLAKDREHTALMLAADSARTDAVRFLLGRGADPRTSDLDGKTALHHAATSKFTPPPRLLSLLLARGARAAALDGAGRTAAGALRRTCDLRHGRPSLGLRTPGIVESLAVLAPAERLDRHMGLWRLWGPIVGKLVTWHARATERAYAPGGGGFREAACDFERRAAESGGGS